MLAMHLKTWILLLILDSTSTPWWYYGLWIHWQMWHRQGGRCHERRICLSCSLQSPATVPSKGWSLSKHWVKEHTQIHNSSWVFRTWNNTLPISWHKMTSKISHLWSWTEMKCHLVEASRSLTLTWESCFQGQHLACRNTHCKVFQSFLESPKPAEDVVGWPLHFAPERRQCLSWFLFSILAPCSSF